MPTEYAVIPTESYEFSVARLAQEWPQLNLVVERLIQYVQRFPNMAPRIADSHARVVKSRETIDFPAVSLVYRTKHDRVYLYLVIVCDPLMEAVVRGHA